MEIHFLILILKEVNTFCGPLKILCALAALPSGYVGPVWALSLSKEGILPFPVAHLISGKARVEGNGWGWSVQELMLLSSKEATGSLWRLLLPQTIWSKVSSWVCPAKDTPPREAKPSSHSTTSFLQLFHTLLSG